MFGPSTYRIQRREYRDYQPVFMLLNSLAIIDEPTRRAFMCINGPIWQHYTVATKGASERRLTVMFLGNGHSVFDELLFVGCSWVRRRRQQALSLWSNHPLCQDLDDAAVHALCIELSGRSVLTLEVLQHLRQAADAGIAYHPPLAAPDLPASTCLN